MIFAGDVINFMGFFYAVITKPLINQHVAATFSSCLLEGFNCLSSSGTCKSTHLFLDVPIKPLLQFSSSLSL